MITPLKCVQSCLVFYSSSLASPVRIMSHPLLDPQFRVRNTAALSHRCPQLLCPHGDHDSSAEGATCNKVAFVSLAAVIRKMEE